MTRPVLQGFNRVVPRKLLREHCYAKTRTMAAQLVKGLEAISINELALMQAWLVDPAIYT